MDLLIRLIIWLVELALKAIRDARIQKELRDSGLDAESVRVGEEEDADAVRSRIQAAYRAAMARLQAAQAGGQQALRGLHALERDLKGVPGGRLLADLCHTRVRPVLETHLPALNAAAEGLDGLLPGAVLARVKAVEDQIAAVFRASMQVQVLTALRDSRAHPDDAHRLADADAISTAMLLPLQDFAAAHNITLPAQVPIAAPASPGAEAIWFGLLPDAHPIVFVPEDFQRDLFRYASVPHELGHLLWRDVPGLAAELRAVAGFKSARGMMTIQNGRLYGSLDQLYSAWLPEIWADMVAVLLLGPSALRGLMHSFAQPEHPQAVLTVAASRGAYDEHPPAHLRIHLAAELLYELSFDREAKELRERWDQLHGTPERLIVPLPDGRFFGLPLEVVLEPGRAAVQQLNMAQFTSLAGLRLTDVPGLAMSPGLWARVQRRAEQLLHDAPFNDDGRVVLAAAIQARAQHPERAALITRGLRRAILGRDADEKKVADPSYRPHRQHHSAGAFVADLRAALVLRELLPRRRGLRS